MATGRTGRKTIEADPTDRVTLGLRVTGKLKTVIDTEAKARGRSLSQEAEWRLENSLIDDALYTSPQMRLWAHVVARQFRQAGILEAQRKGLTQDDDKVWMADPECRAAATSRLLRLLVDDILALPGADRSVTAALLENALLGALAPRQSGFVDPEEKSQEGTQRTRRSK